MRYLRQKLPKLSKISETLAFPPSPPPFISRLSFIVYRTWNEKNACLWNKLELTITEISIILISPENIGKIGTIKISIALISPENIGKVAANIGIIENSQILDEHWFCAYECLKRLFSSVKVQLLHADLNGICTSHC